MYFSQIIPCFPSIAYLLVALAAQWFLVARKLQACIPMELPVTGLCKSGHVLQGASAGQRMFVLHFANQLMMMEAVREEHGTVLQGAILKLRALP